MCQSQEESTRLLEVSQHEVSKPLINVGIQQQGYFCICDQFLERQKRKELLHRIVTGGDKWVSYKNLKRCKSWRYLVHNFGVGVGRCNNTSSFYYDAVLYNISLFLFHSNGIIQGEFGLITADGVYHVTAYAIDENGNFRILSMRNIRLSGPLDNSSPSKSQNINPSGIKQTIKPSESTTLSSKGPLVFTTQPTIKPACAGCGYVTTAKPIPNDKLNYQTPLHQTINDFNNGNRPNNANNDKNNAEISNYNQVQGQINPSQNNIITENNQNLNNPNISNVGPNNNPIINQVPAAVSHNNVNNNHNIHNNNNVMGNNNNNPAQQGLLSEVTVSDGMIHVPGKTDIPIKDKYPGMVDGLPNGVEEKDVKDILYRFNYTVGFHGHYKKGLKKGAKIGGYFVNGRDGISRVVTYIADENGFRPKFHFIRLGLDSPETPKEETEKSFGLKSFEFVWYPVE